MKKIWDWLSVENNRNVLSFLGTGLAVIIAGLWTYFTYFNQPVNRQTDSPVTQTREQLPSPADQKPTPVEEQLPQVNAQPVQIKQQPVQVKEQQVRVKPQPVKETLTPTSFSGTYVGISTEGFTRLPVEIEFTNQGGNITGTYKMSGMIGSMQGTVTGNAYNYNWQLGGFSGRGVSYIQGNTIQGTWGYYNSNNNAGTLTAQLQ